MYLAIYRFVPINLLVYLLVYHASVYQSVRPPVCQSVCLSVCLSSSKAPFLFVAGGSFERREYMLPVALIAVSLLISHMCIMIFFLLDARFDNLPLAVAAERGARQIGTHSACRGPYTSTIT